MEHSLVVEYHTVVVSVIVSTLHFAQHTPQICMKGFFLFHEVLRGILKLSRFAETSKSKIMSSQHLFSDTFSAILVIELSRPILITYLNFHGVREANERIVLNELDIVLTYVFDVAYVAVL